MKLYEIGTGYTPIPAQMGAATEIVVEGLTRAFLKQHVPVEILDIQARERAETELPIRQVAVPSCFSGTDVRLGILHKLKRVVYSVSLAAALQKILKQAKEKTVLHFHNQYNLFFFLKLTSPKLRAKARISYTVHSHVWAGAWEEIEKTVKQRYFQEITCVRSADDVLVLNDRTAEHLMQHLGVKPARIHKITNGVNTDTYRILPPAEVEDFCRDQDLTGKKIIFQVGSVCDRKNQLGAVKMLAAYLREHPDTLYVYAGGVIDETYQQQIADFAAQQEIAEQIRYVGELCPGEQLNRYYNAASVTVFPSKAESFGLVIIESLCAGTPVLLPDQPPFTLRGGYQIYRTEDALVTFVDAHLRNSCCREAVRREAAAYAWENAAQMHLAIWNNEENIHA